MNSWGDSGDKATDPAARPPSSHLSLEGLHGSVAVPPDRAGFWKQMGAFFGPAILVSVAYMDPGNWGTDLAGGAEFKYGLLWVVGLASLMAIFLQTIAARVGVATGRDLAQCCHDWYPKWTRAPNWLMAEAAIIACDMAEVLGSAVALNLMFHIPIFWAVIITGADVLLLLALQRFGMRTIEAIVLLLVLTIAVCYYIEIFVLPQTQPGFMEMGRAMFAPHLGSPGMVYVAIGIIGATVMPHVLYLHPALVQSRKFQKDDESIRKAIRYNTIDVSANLSVAFLINAAILVLAALVFYGKTSVTVAGGQIVEFNDNTDWVRAAYLTLAPLLGTVAASWLFAIALLASGQSATIVGTLAGQVVMEGFMRWRIQPWLRRLITRSLAIIPTIIFIGIRGATNINDLLVLSQVILALQLPFAMFPLLHFASSRRKMGRWRLGWFLLAAGWGSALLITAFDFYGLPDAVKEAWRVIVGG
ncbi:MAG: Nramp family divalent metal transporter [Verrucomicrobia bacterium]|nr:Nramp family divalent metal transporter [Verrucomicrobiota bacterium]MDE3098710.1 Nramp family divalent metal transporter [Verrucomicrobiota bacterium]